MTATSGSTAARNARRRRGAAPVVTDLEHVRAERVAARARADRPPRRARRRRRRGPSARRDRCGRRTSCRWRRDRPSDRGHGASTSTRAPPIVRAPHSVARAQDRHAARAELGEQRGVLAACALELALAGVPERAERDAVEPATQAAEVIGMRMREHRGANGASPSRAQHGREDALPDIDRAADEPAAVDDHRGAVGQIDDRRVALPDVEDRDAQDAASASRARARRRSKSTHRRCARQAPSATDARVTRACRAKTPTAIAASCPAVGAGTGARAPGKRAKPCATPRTSASAPDAARAQPRSARGQRLEERVRETERQRSHLAERHGDEVRDDAPRAEDPPSCTRGRERTRSRLPATPTTARTTGASHAGARASDGTRDARRRGRAAPPSRQRRARTRDRTRPADRASAIPATDRPNARAVSGLRERTCARSAALRHPRGADRRAAAAGEVRVDPRERQPEGRGDAKRRDARRERRKPRRAARAPRRRTSRRRARGACPRRRADGRGRSAGTRADPPAARSSSPRTSARAIARGVGGKRREDALAQAIAHVGRCVAPRPRPARAHDEVVRAAREQHAAPRLRRAWIACVVVPEPVARRELRDRLDRVAAREHAARSRAGRGA